MQNLTIVKQSLNCLLHIHSIIPPSAISPLRWCFNRAIIFCLQTMIVVTADHSHTMTIMGYPKRGADIRGMTGNNATDGLPEAILSYANGKGIYRQSPIFSLLTKTHFS